MNYDIAKHKRTHGFLICMDSDGTVIDAMNIKHMRCHLPAFIETFGLAEREEEARALWLNVNLREDTRGSNRYKVLGDVLSQAKKDLIDIGDIEPLISWARSTDDLSDRGLIREIERNDAPVLRKMLEFSRCTDQKLSKLSQADKPPFKNAEAFLRKASDKADLAIVSGSTSAAIIQEWAYFDILKYVSLVTTREHGEKANRLRKLSEAYPPGHVLMIGDAVMDLEAAEEAGVYFYPINVGAEEESWQLFTDKYFGSLLDESYGNYQKQLSDEFRKTFK